MAALSISYTIFAEFSTSSAFSPISVELTCLTTHMPRQASPNASEGRVHRCPVQKEQYL